MVSSGHLTIILKVSKKEGVVMSYNCKRSIDGVIPNGAKSIFYAIINIYNRPVIWIYSMFL